MRLSAQHRQLVSKHDDLELFEVLRARTQEHELEHAAQRQVAERPEQEQTAQGNDWDGTNDSTAAPHVQSRNRVNASRRLYFLEMCRTLVRHCQLGSARIGATRTRSRLAGSAPGARAEHARRLSAGTSSSLRAISSARARAT